MSCSAALQRAVYDALVLAMPSMPVYADVPEDSVFPYVVIGEDILTEYSTATTNGWRVSLNVHVWGRQPSRLEVKNIQAEVYAALHRQELTVEGFHFITCEFENEYSFLDSDAKTRQGVQTFAIYIDQLL